jgi:hypothetical protein
MHGIGRVVFTGVGTFEMSDEGRPFGRQVVVVQQSGLSLDYES